MGHQAGNVTVLPTAKAALQNSESQFRSLPMTGMGKDVEKGSRKVQEESKETGCEAPANT